MRLQRKPPFWMLLYIFYRVRNNHGIALFILHVARLQAIDRGFYAVIKGHILSFPHIYHFQFVDFIIYNITVFRRTGNPVHTVGKPYCAVCLNLNEISTLMKSSHKFLGKLQ